MKRSSGMLLAAAAAVLWLTGMVVCLMQQEIPAGRLRGKVLAEESGQPLPGVMVRLHLLQPLQEKGERDFAFRTRKDGSFRSGRLPAGLYELQASSRAHTLRATSLLIEEGKEREVSLELAPIAPFFNLRLSQHIFTPDEIPQVMGHGFLPGGAIDFSLYRVDAAILFREHRGSLGEMLYSQEPPEHLALEAPGFSLLQRFSAPITARDVEGIFRQRFDLPLQEPGLYVVVARADSLQRIDWITITRLGLIIKHCGEEALAYVADLKSGQPVAGAEVQFLAVAGAPIEFPIGERKSLSGKTNEQGIFQKRLPMEKGGSNLLTWAEKDGSQAFLTSWVYRGEEEGQERIYAYTDRPIYRPGHQVYFKGIARRFVEPGYAVLSNEPVEVKVWDPRDTLVYKETLCTNDFGSYHGGFRLNEEAATGRYRLVSTIAGRPHEFGFKVAEYRKPEYRVEVSTDKKRYTRGEKIEVRVAAEYYFGAPVAGAKVDYRVMRSPHWLYPGEVEGEDYEDYGEEGDYEYDTYGEVVEEGSAETDADGMARFSISTRPAFRLGAKSEAEEEPQDYLYTIEATVTDPSRKEVSEEATALVTAGEFALLLEPVRYLAAPGEAAEVEVKARNYEGRPLPGVRIEIKAHSEVWLRDRVEIMEETRGRVTTDAKGSARFRFTPQREGHYRLTATARDRRGNRLRAITHLWVTAEFYADLGVTYPELEIVADKKTYRVGEKATLLINSQHKGATALVSVEGPRLYECRLVALKGKSTRLEIPIKPEYAPNFFISVAFVLEKKFVHEQKRIHVSVEERGLQIEVKPDKPRYSPGEQVTYQLRTRDWQGKPVPAEVSLGAVDESIYALQEETAPPMLGFFYPPRENRVSTHYSFPQIYLDAEKETAGIKVRKHFPDTAYWNPTIITGEDGETSLSFTMPDTLTTWRATVRGATLETAVGEATAKVKCSKDLLVRLEAPRFFVQKDRLSLSAVVHNYTTTLQQLKVWMDHPGLSWPGGIPAKKLEQFSLPPGGIKRVDFPVEVFNPGAKEITAYVEAESGLSDAMALTLLALPHGRERMEWRSGAVVEKALERFVVRRDAVPGASDLRLRLAPSIASVILGALEYLAQYPYGCTEQTMSAFLPDVLVARALRELKVSNPQLEKELPDMVQKGLNRLYNFQHDDGGWGWWRYDQSDAWMSAYVVFGLLMAKENGFPVNEHLLNRGLEWLLGQVRRQPAHLSAERAYILYVLSLAGKDGLIDRHLTEFYRNLDGLDSYALALVTTTLLERKREREAKVAAERLWRRAEESQALLWWKGRGDWGRGGDVETTALALKALLALDAREARLFKVVRWLVLRREGNHWVSTRDTAFVLFALTDLMKVTRELCPDYEAAVSLNGKPLFRERFTEKSVFAPEVEVKVSGDSLRAGENLFSVSKAGQGNLYYTIIFRQFVGQEDLPRLITGAGISVQRDYFTLVSTRNPRSGVITTSPSPTPRADFRCGEAVLVRLTITSPREYEYLVLEDPLPAGCEVSERGNLERWEWDWWWSDLEVRDEKVAFFARRLPAGTSTIEYHLRPQIPGDYHVMPTQIYSMYNPDVRGSGAETRVRLR